MCIKDFCGLLQECRGKSATAIAVLLRGYDLNLLGRVFGCEPTLSAVTESIRDLLPVW